MRVSSMGNVLRQPSWNVFINSCTSSIVNCFEKEQTFWNFVVKSKHQNIETQIKIDNLLNVCHQSRSIAQSISICGAVCPCWWKFWLHLNRTVGTFISFILRRSFAFWLYVKRQRKFKIRIKGFYIILNKTVTAHFNKANNFHIVVWVCDSSVTVNNYWNYFKQLVFTKDNKIGLITRSRHSESSQQIYSIISIFFECKSSKCANLKLNFNGKWTSTNVTQPNSRKWLDVSFSWNQ